MPIHYNVISCTNPAGAAGTDYACNHSVQERPMTAAQFVKQIETDTSYTRADVVGVLTAMAIKIQEYLLAGHHVDLKDGITNLGILSPAVMGKCFLKSQVSTEGFDPGLYITGAKINMRPSTELKNEFASRAKLQRVPSTLMP